MAHPNRSQTDADDIQKLISQYFPQPELLADHPPGAEGYWQPQQRQQEQEQQSTSHPNQQTSLPQQPSLYPPIPPHAAQPWNDSSTTVESGMPARYPQGRSLPEQRSFQDLMRVIQNERVATALPGASSQPYSPSLSHQFGASGSGAQTTPGVSSHTIIELRSSSPPTGVSLASGPSPLLPHTQSSSTAGPQDELYWKSAGVSALPQLSQGSARLSTDSQASTKEDAQFQMYECGICVASFSRKHDMERHRRTHTGESPYECEGCGAMFTRSDGRGRHFKLQPECEVAHYAKTQGKPKRKGSLAAGSGDELATSKTRVPSSRKGAQ